MRRPRSTTGRATWASGLLLFGLAIGLGLIGCRQVEEQIWESEIEVSVPPVGSPASVDRLRGLLMEKGTRPGSMTATERREVEELVRGLLPATDGWLADHWWEVKYLDLPGVDFVSAELMRGEGTADRQVWIQILPMEGQPLAGFEPGDLASVGPYRARGRVDHHLFVRVGRIDVRIVADKPEARDDAFLRRILDGCRLDVLASI